MMTSQRRRVLVLAVVVILVCGGALAGQEGSSLDASEAEAFLGTWMLTMETPRGTNELQLTIMEVDGKVAAELSGGRGGSVTIHDISKSDDALVLRFERRFRGNARPVVLTLSVTGDTLTAKQDMGQFSMSGTGEKQK